MNIKMGLERKVKKGGGESTKWIKCVVTEERELLKSEEE
jgi:hypothetical protein